jgi:hypothetical protein
LKVFCQNAGNAAPEEQPVFSKMMLFPFRGSGGATSELVFNQEAPLGPCDKFALNHRTIVSIVILPFYSPNIANNG